MWILISSGFSDWEGHRVFTSLVALFYFGCRLNRSVTPVPLGIAFLLHFLFSLIDSFPLPLRSSEKEALEIPTYLDVRAEHSKQLFTLGVTEGQYVR
jgi:hypothetical protein